MFVEDRSGLKELFQENVSTIQAELMDEKKIGRGINFLKSYMIETHLDDFTTALKLMDIRYETKKTNDEILNIKLSIKGKFYYFYLDFLNQRFPILHTLTDVGVSDPFIYNLVKSSHDLDHIWFTRKFMLNLSELGEFKSFTIRFNRDKFSNYGEYGIERMSMRLWGKAAKKVLDVLEDSPEINKSMAITNVGFKYFTTFGAGIRSQEFINDNITFNGKLTAWGASISPHLSLLEKIRNSYSKQISDIENQFLIDLSFSKGSLGQYYTIELETPLKEIETFLSILLNPHGPVRLIGFYQKVNNGFYRVTCIDQHVGKKLRLEVMEDKIRVYLHNDGCGNTIPRILTLLQHHLESTTGKDMEVVSL